MPAASDAIMVPYNLFTLNHVHLSSLLTWLERTSYQNQGQYLDSMCQYHRFRGLH
jgi:hypothetical protein